MVAEMVAAAIEADRESTTARYVKLRKALEFYTDKRRYHGPNQPPIPDDPYEPQDGSYILDVGKDYGRIARQAIEETREE
jgi:hypothetical protein